MRVAPALLMMLGILLHDAPPGRAQTELVVREVIETDACADYGDGATIVHASGFWAKAGSNVTVVARPPLALSDDTILAAVPEVPCLSWHRSPADLRDGVDYSGWGWPHLTARDFHSLDVGGNTALPNPHNLYGVTGIYLDEKRDRPCLIRIYGRLLDPRYRTGDRKLGEYELEDCKELFPGGLQNPLLVLFEGSDNRFLRAIRVCLGGNPLIYEPPLAGVPERHKIKGLQARAAEVSSVGAVLPRDKVVTDDLPHCADWAGWHSCPDGRIVAGLRLLEVPGRFSALAVECAKVRLVTAPRVLLQDEDGF
jgi:hypothetical protein